MLIFDSMRNRVHDSRVKNDVKPLTEMLFTVLNRVSYFSKKEGIRDSCSANPLSIVFVESPAQENG